MYAIRQINSPRDNIEHENVFLVAYFTLVLPGYAKRGLRSAISSAVKDGITVQEVMQAPVVTQELSGQVRAGDLQKGVTVGGDRPAEDWSQIATEMSGVDKTWVKNKGSHAGMLEFLSSEPPQT